MTDPDRHELETLRLLVPKLQEQLEQTTEKLMEQESMNRRLREMLGVE